MIPNNAANYAANIKDTFIDTRSCAAAKLPSQARARGGGGGGNQDQMRDKNIGLGPPPGKNILLGRTELGSLAERKLTV